MIDCGVPFTLTADTISTTTSTSNLILLTTSASVPVLFQRLVVTSNQTASSILQVRLGIVTGATGGTAITPRAESGSVTASTTCAYVATLGTLTSPSVDAQQWNTFSPYEFNQIPKGFLIPVSTIFGLQIPVAPGAAITVSFTAEFVELK
jgi:hypothetical protein